MCFNNFQLNKCFSALNILWFVIRIYFGYIQLNSKIIKPNSDLKPVDAMFQICTNSLFS